MVFTTVIARYGARSKVPLERLLRQLKDMPTKIVLVENSDASVTTEVVSRDPRSVYIKRPNLGMNIGAWEAATPYIQTEKIVYLQDECSLIQDQAYEELSEILDRYSAEAIFGESLNKKWDIDWLALQDQEFSYEIKNKEFPRGIPRSDYYRRQIVSWGIDPGNTGRHLRSLVLYMTYANKMTLGSFHTGLNKEQCIAAEIAISKKAELHGLKVLQINPKPFYYFKHHEWNDGQTKLTDATSI